MRTLRRYIVTLSALKPCKLLDPGWYLSYMHQYHFVTLYL